MKKSLIFIIILAIILIIVILVFSLNLYILKKDKLINYEECKKQGGTINDSIEYWTNKTCPLNYKYLGRIKDSSMYKICCK